MVKRIVTGGQTGVDRAALDVAIQMGIPHGGWCPRGRRAEDGRIPSKYKLRECESPQYHVRTEKNVIDSDGTLILYRGRLQGGTDLTRRMAAKHGKPCALVDLSGPIDVASVCGWLADHGIDVLNIAGPRESTSPGISDEVVRWLPLMLVGTRQEGGGTGQTSR